MSARTCLSCRTAPRGLAMPPDVRSGPQIKPGSRPPDTSAAATAPDAAVIVRQEACNGALTAPWSLADLPDGIARLLVGEIPAGRPQPITWLHPSGETRLGGIEAA